MNKIMIAARLAKGISEKEVADKLEIEESVYKELELEITDITIFMAERLESLYNIPAEYFIGSDLQNNIKECIKALEDQKEIIVGSDIQNISIPAQTHIAIAKMGLDALIAKQEHILLLRRNKELESMNAVLRELYKKAEQKQTVQEHIL